LCLTADFSWLDAFFVENIWRLGEFCVSLHRKVCPSVGGIDIYIDGETLASKTASLERRFQNVACLCLSNLATLQLETAVMK